jgi:hypothetical protein
MSTQTIISRYNEIYSSAAPYCPGSQTLRKAFTDAELLMLKQYATLALGNARVMTINSALICPL